jgi:hypothetical protein
LEVTNVKDLHMVELWDDRCVQVVSNTGEPVARMTTRTQGRQKTGALGSDRPAESSGILSRLRIFLAL